MSGPYPPNSQQRPRPSTPASSAPVSNYATPRSHPAASSQASPSKGHTRNPSDNLTPTGRGLTSQPMQRTISSGRGSSLSASAAPSHRAQNAIGSKSIGAPNKRPAGKSVPGMSSAGKSFGVDGTGSRPNTPSGTGSSTLAVASPVVRQGSPAPSSQGGAAHLDALGGLISPALSGLAAMPGSVPMIPSLSNLSGLGLGQTFTNSSTGRKIDDEERRKRLESVLGTLRKRPGNVSRQAIMRLGRKCGLDMLPESDDNIIIAGKSTVVIDLHYSPNNPTHVDSVALSLDKLPEKLNSHCEKASRILQKDLTPSNGTAAINFKLDKFADNLERLATMDRLSKPGANCFEAIYGVYKGLKTLYDHERKMATDLQSSHEQKLQHLLTDVEVMCMKSGRPRLHGGRRVGLSLEYWKHQNRSKIGRAANETPMDNDSSGDITDEQTYSVHSLTVECEHCLPGLYTPIRVSEAWLAERVLIPQEESTLLSEGMPSQEANTDLIDWQDPPPTFLAPADEMNGTLDAVAPSLPKARFVAHLEPPISVPLAMAASMYASVDMDIQSEGFVSSPYDAIVLPPPLQSRSTSHNPQHPRSVSTTRSLTTSSSGSETTYDVRLFLPRPEHAITISKLPFAHPRQLVVLLPVLRQYAFLARVLSNTFQPSTTQSAGNLPVPIPTSTKQSRRKRKRARSTSQPTEEDSIEAFLAAPPVTGVPRTIDATFTLLPSPSIQSTFPTRVGLKSVSFAFGLNGSVTVETQNIFGMDGGEVEGGGGETTEETTEEKLRKMARALEVCEDLGVWVVWVRKVLLGEVVDDLEEEGKA